MNAAELSAPLDRIFSWVPSHGPGGAVGIYRTGHAPILRGYGRANIEHDVPITPQTMFHIASISKQFTAATLGLLARDGTLDLDARLGEYFPDFGCGQEITLRQILHHTSGLRDQWGMLDLAGWRHEDLKTTADVLRLAQQQNTLNFAPASRFQYINTGYTLLGEIVRQITGHSLRDIAQTRLFDPLGMNATHFHDDFGEITPHRALAYSAAPTGELRVNVPAYATAGPTGVFSSVEDFAKWDAELSNTQVLGADLCALMQTSGRLANDTETGYGFGLALGHYRGAQIVEHAGGDAAFRSHYMRFPEHGLGIAIFCNTPQEPAGQLARQIADLILGDALHQNSDSGAAAHASASRAAGVRASSADLLLPLCGKYAEAGGHDSAEFRYDGAQFALCTPAGERYDLIALEGRRFAFEGLDASLDFEVRDGAPTILRTYYGSTETAMLEAVADDQASDDQLDPNTLVGQYYSQELDVIYRVSLKGQNLMLNRGKMGTDPLICIGPNQYTCAGGLGVAFALRDGAGAVMRVSTERVWQVEFAPRL